MESKNHPTLSAATLMFVYFAAMAAGMVELSLAAGYLTGTAAVTPLLVLAGVATLAGGLAFLAWSLWGLHRNTLVFTRYALPVLALTAAAHLAVTVAGVSTQRSLNVSHFAALGLTLMAVAGAGWLRRHYKTNDGGAHGQPRTGRLLAAAFGAAVVVATVATPGLAASMAGQHALPHGEHGQAPHGETGQGSNPALDPGRHH
ncbi:hypothetical protein [Paenarthrobacter aurescens]|uniref:Integral membrane protein n=1 Tax=Paenarthrobacter aurescens TaxID=43663 RepID=A0A4Y3NKI3_PAEAU|nr:hypothetical protein [Paenarthrobacter aurescens]MDO6143031.1 hypothetical protein [Paenarthrobacter aurescens]MDO6146876.1 hypothetical protein [Paenarthrobacter aurescens]MDO6158122.1 hypothetical protein [Paenarthrobacter aurescens]MDO6162107.1 hypothetical protein [Paenarthrobacter aurescens]GEB20965.1 hypothetical protein AAU01_37200 [Paenarthrobacter aurescens]